VPVTESESESDEEDPVPEEPKKRGRSRKATLKEEEVAGARGRPMKVAAARKTAQREPDAADDDEDGPQGRPIRSR
jgi:hypothetical protein